MMKRVRKVVSMIAQHQAATSTANSLTPSQVFQERVCRLEGVLAIETRDNGKSEPVIVVYLQPEDQHTERRVYELESAVYDEFPGEWLEVLVLRHRDAADHSVGVAA
jgi:hypothetical protein